MDRRGDSVDSLAKAGKAYEANIYDIQEGEWSTVVVGKIEEVDERGEARLTYKGGR